MGLWLSRAIVEQQLTSRAQVPTQWPHCSVCGTQLNSIRLCETACPHISWLGGVAATSRAMSDALFRQPKNST